MHSTARHWIYRWAGFFFLLCFYFCFCFCFVLFFSFWAFFPFFFRGNWLPPSFLYKTKQAIRLVTCFFVEKHSMEWHFYFGLTNSFFTVILFFWFIKIVGKLFNLFAFPAKWPVPLVEALLLFLIIILVLIFFLVSCSYDKELAERL